MKNLYVDTDTSNYWLYGSHHKDEEQPYLIRLSWLLDDMEEPENGRRTAHIVKMPDKMNINPQTAFETGIFDHHVREVGMMPESVLEEFAEAVKEADRIIAHNWARHRAVIECAERRACQPEHAWPPHVCIMHGTTQTVKAPWKTPKAGYKPPAYQEVMEYFLGKVRQPTMNPVEDGISKVRDVRAVFRLIGSEDGDDQGPGADMHQVA